MQTSRGLALRYEVRPPPAPASEAGHAVRLRRKLSAISVQNVSKN